MYASHYENFLIWPTGATSPWSGVATEDTTAVSTTDIATNVTIDSAFPKGSALAKWVVTAGASTTPGSIPTINNARSDVLGVTAPTTAWRAIVSTSTMSAVNNISCGAACNANVPIFLVDGTEVATSTNNLFGGSAGILNVIDEDENAGAVAGAYVAGTNQLAFWYA